MLTLALIVQLFALVCLVLATFGVTARVNLTAAGLTLWLLSTLVH